MRKVALSTAILFGLLLPGSVFADNLARDYGYAPPGTMLFLVYDYHVSAHTAYDNGDKLTDDANVSGDVWIFRPVYYHDYGFLNLHGAQQVLFFAKDIDAGGVRISGLSDMLYSPEVWLYRNETNKVLLGFIPHITVPIGQYDEDRAGLSAGGNRWAVQPELNFTYAGLDKFVFEVTGAAQFFEDNKDWYDATLKQDPLYTIELHASYDISPAWWLAADYYWHGGGETKVGGVKSDDEVNTHTLGASAAFGLSPNHQLVASYQYDVKVEEGAQYQTIALRFMYAF